MNVRNAMMWLIANISLVACGAQNEQEALISHVERYSLCPRADDSWERLYALVTEFAEDKGATVFDRSAEAQRELAAMRSSALRRTGGALVVLTVSKPERFRVGITNLGLKEKAALAITYWEKADKDPDRDLLLADIDRFWIVEAVEGGVLDDPLCP